MYHPLLCPTCAIHIVDGAGDASLDHRYPARQVQVVVQYLRDALVRILRHVVPFGHVREKAVRVIQVFRLRVGAVPEVERLADRRCRRVVADRRQLVAVVGVGHIFP